MAQLLLIDDDPGLILMQLRLAFPDSAYRIEAAYSGAEGIERIRASRPDVILLDVRLPDRSGPEVYQEIRKIDTRIPVIFVTVVKTADQTIDAMRQGAYDYLFKPLDLHQLRRVVGEALEVSRRMRQQAVIAETDAVDVDQQDTIVGSCPAMREVYKATAAARCSSPPAEPATTRTNVRRWCSESSSPKSATMRRPQPSTRNEPSITPSARRR